MTREMISTAVIVGSVRRGRFAPVVARWFATEAGRRDDMVFDMIDLADADGSHGLPARFAERVESADAFVVITPEYNHGYPGPLKTAIDSVYAEWRAKPVAFVSYGGISGGLRSVEQLRGVFAELHAVTVRETVSFHGAGERFTEEGHPRDARAVGDAATIMLDQLAWWARALREARRVRPYAA